MDMDCNELLEHFSKSVVRINIYRKIPDPKNPGDFIWPLYTVIPGIVTVSTTEFCHIIVLGRRFFYNQSLHVYEVAFPDDETTVLLDLDTVSESDWLAAFYVRTKGQVVEPVQFNEKDASCREKVWMFGYNNRSQSLLEDGSVTHVGDDNFAHNCPPNSMASRGYPIFTMKNKLAGISYSDYGVTYALSVLKMTDLLSRFFEETIDKPLHEILQHIRAVGEKKCREHLDSAGPSDSMIWWMNE